jgi:hypothetical protein
VGRVGVIVVATGALMALSACASTPRHYLLVPTPSKPVVACIDRGVSETNKRTGNTMIPEAVTIIGVTPELDGERWMVVRGVYDREGCVTDINDQDKCAWEPWSKERIRFVRCGPGASAMREVFDASSQSAPAVPGHP